jgi:hypothetical protein
VASQHSHGGFWEAEKGDKTSSEGGKRVHIGRRGSESLEIYAAADVEAGAEETAGTGENYGADGISAAGGFEGVRQVIQELRNDGVGRRPV